jgi:hypothetical protein
LLVNVEHKRIEPVSMFEAQRHKLF